MTRRELEDIRGRSNEELQDQMNDLLSELRQLKTKIGAGGAVDKPSRMRSIRRRVARIRTVQRERQLGLDVERSTG